MEKTWFALGIFLLIGQIGFGFAGHNADEFFLGALICFTATTVIREIKERDKK